MRRHARFAFLLILFGAAAAAAGDGPQPGGKGSRPPAGPPEPLAVRLFRPIKFNGFADPKTTLGEALTHLGDLYDVTFDVNEAAFEAESLNDVRSTPIARRPIPRMTNTTLDRVLRTLLARLPVPSGAVYMVRGNNTVELTTAQAQRPEVWGGQYQGPYLPLVQARFDRRPLDEALRALAKQAAYSVVLDAHAGDRAKAPVSGAFANVPLDTAVRVLADMAGLKTAQGDNVLYVTAAGHPLPGRPAPEEPSPAGGLGGPGPAGLGMGTLLLQSQVRHAPFERRPLLEALQDVLKPGGLKLVVDARRVGEAVKTPVSIDLDGATVEAAVRVLADQADLAPVFLDNVIYLTTKENARSMPAAPRPRAPLGGLGLR
jgi:hypothetical protein